MVVHSDDCLFSEAVSFSSLEGRLWTLIGQVCESPRQDTWSHDQGQAVTLPSPELPGLGETLRNNGGAGAASPWREAGGHLGLGGSP